MISFCKTTNRIQYDLKSKKNMAGAGGWGGSPKAKGILSEGAKEADVNDFFGAIC